MANERLSYVNNLVYWMVRVSKSLH